MNSLSNNITTTYEGLGMLHSVSNSKTVSFAQK